jgi:hypothetical protein
MYTVPKLEDYSPESLDRAVARIVRCLDKLKNCRTHRKRLEGISRSLAGAQERRPHSNQ